ncbi:MAG: hypothetical protein ABI707_03055 [Ferruginibacter sp.]
MKKEKAIATAANSKTMNAVENVKLFAAAAETEPAINFMQPDNDLGTTSQRGNKSRIKQNNNSAGK